MEKIGTVKAVFIRFAHGRPVERAESLRLVGHNGIIGDVNFSSESPRHLLLKSLEGAGGSFAPPGYFNENVSLLLEPGAMLSVGDVLQVGSATLFVRSQNERCKVFASEVSESRGVHCVCVEDGLILPSAKIFRVRSIDIFSDSRLALLTKGLASVPFGRVVTFKDACIMIGGSRSHLRTLPSLIRSAIDAHATDTPFHRLVRSRGELLGDLHPRQESLLASEGVLVSEGKVQLQSFHHLFERNPFCRI